jgi:hypothetical protein
VQEVPAEGRTVCRKIPEQPGRAHRDFRRGKCQRSQILSRIWQVIDLLLVEGRRQVGVVLRRNGVWMRPF